MERISTHQFMMLGAGVALGTTFFPVGTLMAGFAGRDGWMVVLPGFLFGIPFGFMLLSLSGCYPGKNFLQITEKLLGKWASKIMGISAILISSYFGGLLSGQGIDMFSRSILPLMPRWAFLFTGFILVFMLVFVGIEVLARFSEIIFPIVALALMGTALLSYPRFEKGELFPFFENGVNPLFNALLQIIPWPMELILFMTGLLAFLPQNKQDIKQMKTQIWRIFLLIGFLDMLISLVEIWVFGPTEAARLTYGLLTLGKMIELSRTIAGIESIFTIIWMGALIIKITAFYFIAFWGVQTVFGVKPWSAHLIIIPIFLSVPWMLPRGSDLVVEIGLADSYLILPFTGAWVVLIWGVNWWKQRRAK